MESFSGFSPTSNSERILSLDVLRGVAVLGILAMNIQLFAMIDSAYQFPTSYGDLTGVNEWVWYLKHLMADMKFMTIFSILFGAGIVMMADRTAAKAGSPFSMHCRRMGWLLVFGLVHAYVFWWGDILVTYAICGMCVYPLHRWGNRWLIPMSVFLLAVPSLLLLGISLTIPYWPAESIAEMRAEGLPGPAAIQNQVEIYRGGWAGQMGHRAMLAFSFQTLLLALYSFWRVSALMLLGMVLSRTGFLRAGLKLRTYGLILFVGFAVGLSLTHFGVVAAEANAWDPLFVTFTGLQYNYWGSLFTAAAWIAVVMILCKEGRGVLRYFVEALAATGRMALTNYLAQTLICCFIFYGYGLGLFGNVDRWQQLLIMLGVWALQLFVSPLWMRSFRFGPMEWAWRSLVLWKRQPMRKAA